MNEQINKNQKLINWILDSIQNGTLKPGDRLMSEPKLSSAFGVSRQTVRRATGELVEKGVLTRRHGSGTYIADNCHIQSAKRPVTKNVAVISTFYESYIFPSILRGIEEVLSDQGYSMQVSFTNNQIAREAQILQQILEKDAIDALIVEPAKSALPNPNLHYYDEILKRNIPIICFNTVYPGLNVPCVRIDDRGIAMKATDYLIKHGHRVIAGLFKADDGQGRLRYEGYVNSLMGAGIELDQQHIVWLDTPMAGQLEAFEDYLFKRLSGCSAVLCYNDQIAYQLIDLAIRRGLRVPEDLSVVGIDDSYLATIGQIPITSFPHPKEVLGQTVAANLLHMLEDPSYDGNTLFDSEPIERASVEDYIEK